MAPIIGQAWVAYIPNDAWSASASWRVVDVYARRLRIQEKMTAQIFNTINDVLEPQGVGVIIKAALLHDDARRAQAGHRPRDQPHARLLAEALTRQEFLGMAT